MLKNSDERFVPWSLDFCTGYEHIHRYAIAQKNAENKRILDLACGEGYGTFMLASTAKNVVGIDISQEAIDHANNKYKKDNLSFLTADITDIPIKENHSFDLIVCFEALEHVNNQEALLKEIKRLIKHDGILIISTPNKPVYSENGTRHNPYHFKELDIDEFRDLLRRHFNYLEVYGQKTYAASQIFPLKETSISSEKVSVKQEKPTTYSQVVNKDQQGLAQKYTIEQDPTSFSYSFVAHPDPLPRYFLAFASDQVISLGESESYLIDVSRRQGYIKWENPHEQSLPRQSKLRFFLSKLKKGLKFLCSK